jgi:hypothetical protein
MSKIAINVLTKIMQKNFDDKNNDMPGLVANTVCPGETGIYINSYISENFMSSQD